MSEAPTCPKCGHRAWARQTDWGIRHECCDLWSWGGKPLVDRATHGARRAAHLFFDELWKEYGFDRGEAYKLLALDLEMEEDECHMGRMSYEDAMRVPWATRRILARRLAERGLTSPSQLEGESLRLALEKIDNLGGRESASPPP